MTGCPFFNERPTFCASARQHVTVANRRSLSSHLPVSRSRRREVDATRKLSTGTPELLVVRNRGSSTTLPTMVMYVSFIANSCPSTGPDVRRPRVGRAVSQPGYCLGAKARAASVDDGQTCGQESADVGRRC